MPLSAEYLQPISGKIKQMVLLLHGYGDSGAGLIDIGRFWQTVMPDTAFVAPNAPAVCEGWPAGYQWFSLTGDLPSDIREQARRERIADPANKLNEFIDLKLKDYNLNESNLAVMGFSQGAMMALYALPRRAKPCAAITAYSGLLVDPEGLKESHISRMPVLIVHGDEDNVVPAFCLNEAVAGLQAAHFNVEGFLQKGLGHSIDSEGLERGARFINQAFANAASKN